MSVASDLIRGNTDTIILAILAEGDNYGYGINRVIRQATGNGYELKEATLYIAFRRLEDSGCISSYWGDEESGARRRYYHLTEQGRQQLSDAVEDWKELESMYEFIRGGLRS